MDGERSRKQSKERTGLRKEEKIRVGEGKFGVEWKKTIEVR